MSTANHSTAKHGLPVLCLTALGVVYGDIGTSPLYALRECFSANHDLAVNAVNVLGILSLIFWSLILVITIKYLIFILRADNNGEGGILALTALLMPIEAKSKRKFAMTLLVGILHYGFWDDRDIPFALDLLADDILKLDPKNVTYFLGRENLLVSSEPLMSRWRTRLFTGMSRNAQPATAFFNLPPNRVIELGAQIHV